MAYKVACKSFLMNDMLKGVWTLLRASISETEGVFYRGLYCKFCLIL